MAELPPPENPSIPEAPKKGFNVEVRQPEMLYRVAQNIVSGVEKQKGPFDDRISETEIGDALFSREYTTLRGFENNWGQKQFGHPMDVDGTYYYSTNLDLSTQMIEGPNYGYFSEEKVRKIAEGLVQKGIRVEVNDYFLQDEKGQIKIERDGAFFEILFGYTSREAEESYIRQDAERSPDGYSAKYEVPRIAKGLKNKEISLNDSSQQRYETGLEGYPKLGDEASFKKATNTYIDVYKQIVTTIYEIEGKTPSDKTVILRPPIKSEDTFTNIASSSTETPISVTAEQLRTEAIGFDDIAGQDFAVAEARRLVLAINHPEVFEKRGVKRPKGILFYGPPGTGKTLIAKAVAKEADAEFLQVSAADIGTKWYGESERLMQEVFNIANKAVAEGKKVVIFFDEIDSLAPSREDAHEATKKVVATLLQNMDGMKANPNVTILAATNRPQDIDTALKRPGRFDKLIPVNLPNITGREAIFKVHLEKAKKAATEANDLFSPDINVTEIAQATDGMSGADLANLVNLTLEDKTMAELSGKVWTPITTNEILETAKRLGLVKEEKRRIGFITNPENKT